MGIRRKKKHPPHKKSPAEFGPALAQARKEADHIFKQASASHDSQTLSYSSSPPPAAEVSPRSKAAAWAWYQRGGGSSTTTMPPTNPEEVRNRALLVMRRASRFKAEALRVNGSYTADDTLIKTEHKWDPSQSLFDSFELLCVAKELDKALKEQHPAGLPPAASPGRRTGSKHHLVSLSCSSPSFMRRTSGRKEVSSAAVSFTGLLSRLIPAPVLCLSEADIATAKKSNKIMMRRGSSLGSTAFGRISRLLTYSPSSKSQETVEEEEDDETLHHHRHEHFHHHHHHHHHHESF